MTIKEFFSKAWKNAGSRPGGTGSFWYDSNPSRKYMAEEKDISHAPEYLGRIPKFVLLKGDRDKVENAIFDSDGDYMPVEYLMAIEDHGYLPIPMLIYDIDLNISDRQHVVPFIGDMAHFSFLGRNVLVAEIRAYLLDWANLNGRSIFTTYYSAILRLSAIAKLQIAPILVADTYYMQGGILQANMSENSNMSGVIDLNFSFLVFNLAIYNPYNEYDNTGENLAAKKVVINYSNIDTLTDKTLVDLRKIMGSYSMIDVVKVD